MKDPYALLRSDPESTPAWLSAYAPGQPFPRQAFFSSRVVYYPGSAADGHPLKLFGGTHSAHCFVFVDYGHPKDYFAEQLADPAHPRHPRGYQAVSIASLAESDLVPSGWTQHVKVAAPAPSPPTGGAFSLFAVLERTVEFGDDHGPSRIAILVIGGDGIATYDALFCQDQGQRVPYAVVLQDDCFGGNWTSFGGASLLWELASSRPPQWLLVAANTEAWPGFTRVSSSDTGGMHGHPRSLFRQQ